MQFKAFKPFKRFNPSALSTFLSRQQNILAMFPVIVSHRFCGRLCKTPPKVTAPIFRQHLTSVRLFVTILPLNKLQSMSIRIARQKAFDESQSLSEISATPGETTSPRPPLPMIMTFVMTIGRS